MRKRPKSVAGSRIPVPRRRAVQEPDSEAVVCRCRSGCQTGRCSCRNSGKRCSEACSCKDCANPFQHLEIREPTDCLVQNVQVYLALTEKERQIELPLPCGHAKVRLQDLLSGYDCSRCHEAYWYSFCWQDVVQDSCSWHCKVCRKCRDWREWHCDSCNRCTYGVSLPCENCADARELDW